jgi:hypothetical protein
MPILLLSIVESLFTNGELVVVGLERVAPAFFWYVSKPRRALLWEA